MARHGPAVIREFGRMSALALWPNFTPGSILVAVFDGTRTWRFRQAGQPPSQTAQLSDRDLLLLMF